MAYKSILTPFLGEEKTETLASFMNMKFGELLGNTEDNRQQISILTGRLNVSTYTTLAQLGLTDAQFLGLTQVQALALILTKLPQYTTFSITLGSNEVNFRTALGYPSINIMFKMEVYTFTRYVATISNEANSVYAIGTGHSSFHSGLKTVATTDKIDILWSGNTSTLGDITLNSSINALYDCIIISTGSGANMMLYTIDLAFASTFAITYAFNFQTVSGVGRLTVVNDTTLNLAVAPQPLRSVRGVKRIGY